jgi:hypothetical protein
MQHTALRLSCLVQSKGGLKGADLNVCGLTFYSFFNRQHSVSL